MEEFRKIITSFEPIQMGQLLKNNIFIVPSNQRVYSWNKENWQELWEDLLDILYQKGSAKSNPFYDYHFFGPMFFTPLEEHEQHRILDGQQRLATVSILLRVISDILDSIREKEKISRDGASLLGKIDERLFKTQNNSSLNRVSLGERNRVFYDQVIKSKKNPIEKIKYLKKAATNKTNKKILDCYKFFLNSIILYLDKKQVSGVSLRKVDDEALNKIIKDQANEQFLLDLYNSIVDGLYVLLTIVPTIDVVYEMFETLNQRGEKLLTIDLFKNFLFDRFEKVVGIKKLEFFWNELITILGEEENLKFFLRHFWLSNFEFAREKKLFKSITNKIESMPPKETEFDDFSNHILGEAHIYFALHNPQDPLWTNKEEISQILDEINYLGFTQVLPLFLSVFTKFFENNTETCTNLLRTYLNFAVKRYTVLGESPSEFEEEYSLWARKIRKNEITLDDVIHRLKDLTPKHEEVCSRIIGLEMGERSAKYILSKINDSLVSSALNKCWKNRPTVEHVIPKNPNDTWIKYLESKKIIHRNVIKRLGNLTILGSKENKELGNLDYGIKKKKYLETKLPINIITFKNIKDFDMKAIEKREKIIMELIGKQKLWAT